MATYHWHAHGVTKAGLPIISFGEITSDLDPHMIAAVKDGSLRRTHPTVVWHDCAGRAEDPGDKIMPVLRIIKPTETL